jgi:nicotinamide mononucleotide adenylyltransferase
MEKPTLAVQLGRFAPYHLGHQMVTEAMIERHGIEHCLIIVGSSNVLNDRTPYTFEQRKQFIQSIFPYIQVISMPDINPDLRQFEVKTLDSWLHKIEEMETGLDVRFKFYGGSKEDMRYLSKVFETEVIVDRKTIGRDITATKVREALLKKDLDILSNFVNPKLIPELMNININY